MSLYSVNISKFCHAVVNVVVIGARGSSEFPENPKERVVIQAPSPLFVYIQDHLGGLFLFRRGLRVLLTRKHSIDIPLLRQRANFGKEARTKISENRFLFVKPWSDCGVPTTE